MFDQRWFAIGLVGTLAVTPEVHAVFGPLAFTMLGVVLLLGWVLRLLGKLRSGNDGSFIKFDEFRHCTFDEQRSYDWAACRSPDHLGLGCSGGGSSWQGGRR